jgi:hypothetical protein
VHKVASQEQQRDVCLFPVNTVDKVATRLLTMWPSACIPWPPASNSIANAGPALRGDQALHEWRAWAATEQQIHCQDVRILRG